MMKTGKSDFHPNDRHGSSPDPNTDAPVQG